MSDQRTVDIPPELRSWLSGAVAHPPGSSGGGTAVREPDHAVRLVYRSGVPGSPGDLVVVGPRVLATYHLGKEIPYCLQVRLRPGRVATLLGVPARDLIDRMTPLNDLWGARGAALAERLAPHDHDDRSVLGLMGAELLSVLSQKQGHQLARSDLASRAAAQVIGRQVDGPAMAGAATSLGISERLLRNLFADEIGLSPKGFQRVERLRRVLSLAGTTPLADVAARAGFYDQSHLNGDFRTMMGVPPGAFLAGRLPQPSAC